MTRAKLFPLLAAVPAIAFALAACAGSSDDPSADSVDSAAGEPVVVYSGRSEELITELKQDYTVVMVTHNMQQAARCSDHTAFMYLGELIEFSDTDTLFTKPAQKQTEDYITGRYG